MRTFTTIRVRYVETDQMGVAHHSSYFAWMEEARTELLRERGMAYRELEARGVFLPVREAFCRYRKSLRYDDVAVVEAELIELGNASIRIGYRIFLLADPCGRPPGDPDEARPDLGSLVADGYTLHPFTDGNGKVIRAPRFFIDLFR